MNDPKIPADSPSPATDLTRRNFLRSSAAAGSALYLATGKRAYAQAKADALNIAIVGCGDQGNALMNASRGTVDSHGINYVAVCDIWEVNRSRMARTLQKYGFPVKDYIDIEDMLSGSPEIDAVLIATPDFMHAPHSRLCLEAGKQVYCEKMMSNTLEGATDMVRAQRETGKLLQIGHQRRSNPRYLNAHNNVINGAEILGRVTHAYGQWNRAVSQPIGAPKSPLDQATLQKYGYGSMMEFRNWRWYQEYGGGPVSDLGAHQIDLFNWMFNTTPKSIIASGGIDYYDEFEMPDNAMIIYEYDTPKGIARAYYQVLTTTSSQSFYEKFMGTDGTVTISEVAANGNQAYREAHAEPWVAFGEKGFLSKEATKEAVHHKFWEHPKPWYRPSKWLDTGNIVDVRETAALDPWELGVSLDKPAHQPHLENFFEVCKGSQNQEDLNCPVIEAYKTCVTVLKVNEAIAQQKRLEFRPDEFTVS
ncbi:hypothetical protein BH23VER1_BH23VER1_10180 [soil metagenome]